MTITARVTQAGTVTNTASVTARDQPDPDPTDNTASVTLTTQTIADLAITKTLTGSRDTGAGDDLHDRGDQPRAESGDRRERHRPVPGRSRRAGVDLRRRPGSSCAAASGTGNLATTVTLEAGDRATFIVTGTIAANATGLLVNTATVTVPAGALDPDTGQQHGDQFGDC